MSDDEQRSLNTTDVVSTRPQVSINYERLIESTFSRIQKMCDSRILNKDGTLAKKLNDRMFIMFYFSCGWCPPARKFTRRLVEFYASKQFDQNFEIIYVSLDRDIEEFRKSYKAMPWLHLDFECGNNIDLIERYDVSALPQLTVIRISDEKCVCKNAVKYISDNSKTCDYPWIGYRKSNPSTE